MGNLGSSGYVDWRGVCLGLLLLPGCRAPAKSQSGVTPSSSSTAEVPSARPLSESKPGDATLPTPELDLPADRLHEHVNGSAPALVALGCERLLFWRLTAPESELELFVFKSEAGARAQLDKDSGGDRSRDAPGNEGWSNDQVVYFRQGRAYVRLIASQAAPVPGLHALADRVQRAIASGSIKPNPQE